MLHTKFQGHRSVGSGIEVFFKDFYYTVKPVLRGHPREGQKLAA